MIRHHACVTVVCDRCGEADSQDDMICHYDGNDLARVRRELAEGKFKDPTYNTHLWRWTDDEQVCPDCVTNEIQAACDHEWEKSGQPYHAPYGDTINQFWICFKCDANRLEKVPSPVKGTKS